MILFQQMLILFFVMILGFIMARKKIIDKHVSKSLSWITVNVANPALIISGSQGNSVEGRELIFVLALAFGLFFVMIIFAELIIPLFRLQKDDSGIYKVLLIFSNMGFMGFPIISAVYGNKGLLYAAVFLLPFNILIYTYGIFCMSQQKISLVNKLKNLFNIGLVAGLISLVLAIENISLPNIVCQIIDLLSGLIAPLSMMVIGASFTDISIKKLFCDIKMIILTIIKLILIPLVGIFIIRLITNNALLQGVCFIVLAVPSGSMVAMLAQQYDSNYLTASKGVAITTIFSVITMPLMFAIVGL